MPRWRIPVEFLVEAATPTVARAHVAQRLRHLGTNAEAHTAPTQHHIGPASRVATPPAPLSTRRRVTESRHPIGRERPA